MSTNDTENTQHVITTQPAASPPQTPKRKVSIANDPVSESRYNDNLAFEPCSKRKTSQVVLDYICVSASNSQKKNLFTGFSVLT